MTIPNAERLREIEKWATSEAAECRDDDLPVSARFFEDVVAIATTLLEQSADKDDEAVPPPAEPTPKAI